MVLNDQGFHRERVQRLTGHPTCSTPHCWLQETIAALNLTTVFSISRPLQIGKVSSTIVTPSPSSNIYLCPVSLPRHHMWLLSGPHELQAAPSKQLFGNTSVCLCSAHTISFFFCPTQTWTDVLAPGGSPGGLGARVLGTHQAAASLPAPQQSLDIMAALFPLHFYKSPPHLRSHHTVGLSRRRTAGGGRIEFLYFVMSMGRALQSTVHPAPLMPPGSSRGALPKYLSILSSSFPAPSFHIFN